MLKINVAMALDNVPKEIGNVIPKIIQCLVDEKVDDAADACMALAMAMSLISTSAGHNPLASMLALGHILMSARIRNIEDVKHEEV